MALITSGALATHTTSSLGVDVSATGVVGAQPAARASATIQA
jgi:hypothetical protein